MPTTLTTNGATSFRITRPKITSNGLVSDVDPTIQKQLDEINALLGKRIFERSDYPTMHREAAAQSSGSGGMDELTDERWRPEPGGVRPDVEMLLMSPLTPKHVPGNDWANGSLLWVFNEADEKPDNLTLAEYIDRTPKLAELKYRFQDEMAATYFNLDYNTRAVLDKHPAITDYLVAYAFHVMDLRDVKGVRNFVLSNKNGAKNIANYAVVSAARTIIDLELLKVPNYNDDDSEFVTSLLSANLSLSATSFRPLLKKRIDAFVFDTDELKLIESAGIGKIPANLKPLLVRAIQKFPVPLDQNNIKFFLPTLIGQVRSAADIELAAEPDTEPAPGQFEVEYFDDTADQIEISQTAVLAAAQLYYCMVLGDELDIFSAVTYFTNKYVIENGIEIQDRRLRSDLQTYVFSNRFRNLKTGEVHDRTRPAERQMFYRQVFSYGDAPVGEGFIINREFPRLWKVMILESAKYLERARESFHPDSYVSRQNVMQAVEDLQYNLSNHCTGMANVVSPLIYSELEFVVERILSHPDVIRQVAPSGGGWRKVLEQLGTQMRRSRPPVTALNNKAKLGHEIIKSIADYNPISFEDDQKFSAFISSVDAFITTQSIIQETLTDSLRKDAMEEEAVEEEYQAEAPEAVAAAPQPTPAPAAADEWDF